MIVEDLRTETRFSGPPLLTDHGVVSGMSTIIQGKGRPFGVLGAHTTVRRTFTKDDINFLQAISNILAETIERKRGEAELRKFKFILDGAGEEFYLISPGGKVEYANEAAAGGLGYTIEEMTKLRITDFGVEYDTAEKFHERFEKLKQQDIPPFEGHHRTKDGKVIPKEIKAVYLKLGDKEYVCAFAHDITNRKRAEEQLKESLKEKEILLQEIHHRVKNNLQVISSLLDMSRMQTANEEAIDLLKAAGNRIGTMSLIHSQLYRSDRFGRIDMGKHLREVTNSLLQLYGQKKNITIDIKASEVYLPVSQAIPTALVLNELVSNALKHGFSGRPKGMLEISMQWLTNDTVRMYVKDNGVGIPEEADPFKADSLGLKLVRNLVEKQLKGKLQFKRNKGAEFIIEFKDTREDERNG